MVDAQPHPVFLFLFSFPFPLFILFSFAASSSVGTPQLTRADRPSVLVRLHSVPSRSLEKSHPSFFSSSSFPGGQPVSPIMSGIHTPTETVVVEGGGARLLHRVESWW